MATVRSPCPTKPLKARCSVTGSGVVRPVAMSDVPKVAEPPSSGTAPAPRVPITPQRRPSTVSACAIHQVVEVLPLVPVTAITASRSLGEPKNALASGPAAAFRPSIAAMRSSSKP